MHYHGNQNYFECQQCKPEWVSKVMCWQRNTGVKPQIDKIPTAHELTAHIRRHSMAALHHLQYDHWVSLLESVHVITWSLDIRWTEYHALTCWCSQQGGTSTALKHNYASWPCCNCMLCLTCTCRVSNVYSDDRCTRTSLHHAYKLLEVCRAFDRFHRPFTLQIPILVFLYCLLLDLHIQSSKWFVWMYHFAR